MEDGEPRLCPACFMSRRRKNLAKFFEINKTKIFDKCNVPIEYEAANLLHCKPAIQKLVCESCYLFGDRGVGKTYAAVALLREFMLNGTWSKSPLFITAAELLMEIRDTFTDSSNKEAQIIDKYSTTPLLILDDLGAEKISEWTVSTLGIIVDRRYANKRTTIYTSNLSLDQLSGALGDRIASRIAGQCKVVKMNGEDRRVRM